VRRNSIIKYLRQQIDQERTLNQCSKKLMNSQLGEFSMVYFDQFVEAYKATNILAPEALEAFDHFIPALNDFLVMFEDFTEETINDIKIHWYGYSNAANGDYIYAKSKHYNKSAFSNVAINMDVEDAEDYNTDDGTCFGKVCCFTHRATDLINMLFYASLY